MKFIAPLLLAVAAFASADKSYGNRPLGYPAAPARSDDVEIAPVPMPTCAKPCITEAVKQVTQCEETDAPCVCANLQAVTAAATNCVLKECGLMVALGKFAPQTRLLAGSL